MISRLRTVAVGCFGLLTALGSAQSLGSEMAFDSAADPAYHFGWTWGTNGGFGWGGGWMLESAAPGKAFDPSTCAIGYCFSNVVNSPPTDSGRAWEIRGEAKATRLFNGGLTEGQTFSFDFLDGLYVIVGYPGTQHVIATELDGPGGTPVIRICGVLPFPGLTPVNWTYQIANGSTWGDVVDTGVRYSDTGMHLAYTLTGPHTATLSLSATGQNSNASQFDLSIPSVRASIDRVSVEAVQDEASRYGASFFPAYLNNLSITPEPAEGTLILCASVALLLRKRSD